ncbi:type VII secretion system-associated protein [Amycolatopsis sp. WQ 127309]|uniref:type VII secretion system-associated protein n=1 Tax=Amycolatopsis sp. WQ 127309 TaxID=2932773 RepID=UPI001FF2E60A|nr:type VII secretion system-associated protein [Amycolatopsis sp. WQ 127309]UOZ06913.1 type VII secretion system-associated protein [Amycolatopsis sp. WQ 127309]
MSTETEEIVDVEAPEENWLLLLDPSWEPSAEDEEPPLEAVVGLWPVEDDGQVGKFRGNPDYVPSDENSPSDPLDAVLRLMVRGEAGTEQLQAMLSGTLLDVAMNGDGRPLVTKSPDNLLCAVVTTGEPHRARLMSPEWHRTDLAGLVELIGTDLDVLFNPGGPASVRLTGDFLRLTAELTEDELAAIHQSFSSAAEFKTATWEPAPDQEEEEEEPLDEAALWDGSPDSPAYDLEPPVSGKEPDDRRGATA